MRGIGHQTENTDPAILIKESQAFKIAFSKDLHCKSLFGSVSSVWCVVRGRCKKLKIPHILSFCLIQGIVLVDLYEYGGKLGATYRI